MPDHLDRVLDVVCRYYGVTREELSGRSRTRHISRVRHRAMWLARACTPASLEEIGQVLRRDHTTVIYGARQVQNRVESSEASREEARILQERYRAATKEAVSA